MLGHVEVVLETGPGRRPERPVTRGVVIRASLVSGRPTPRPPPEGRVVQVEPRATPAPAGRAWCSGGMGGLGMLPTSAFRGGCGAPGVRGSGGAGAGGRGWCAVGGERVGQRACGGLHAGGVAGEGGKPSPAQQTKIAVHAAIYLLGHRGGIIDETLTVSPGIMRSTIALTASPNHGLAVGLVTTASISPAASTDRQSTSGNFGGECARSFELRKPTSSGQKSTARASCSCANSRRLHATGIRAFPIGTSTWSWSTYRTIPSRVLSGSAWASFPYVLRIATASSEPYAFHRAADSWS